MMKYFISLTLITLLLSSCFTSSLLNSNGDSTPSLSAHSYSLNRAYYTHDGLLHLDFNNLENKVQNGSFYTITLDVNTILEEYKNSTNGDYVKYSGKFARRNRVASISKPSFDSACNTYYQNNNILFVDFRDFKVKEISSLSPIPDSNLMVYTDVVNSDCMNKPGKHPVYYNEGTDNSPNDVYVLQALRDSNKLLALRIPLYSSSLKMELLPAALLLDIITSPFQFGFYVLSNKGEKEPHRKEVKNEVRIQPINPMPIHKPNHP